LIAKVFPQRPDEPFVGAFVGGLAVWIAFAGLLFGGPVLVGAADGELEIGAGEPTRKAAMLDH